MMFRPYLIAAAILAVAAPAARSGEAPKPVRVATIALAPLRTVLTFSGSIQARTQADLAFRVGGKVVLRPVEVGDHVRAGQVLAQLDPADLQLSQEAAEAALQAAEADAANAKADQSRYDALGRNSPAYLPSEYDKRVAANRMAAARLAQAVRQVSLARDQRAYGALTADADGVVTALPVQVGQVVTAGQTVATLAHTAETEVVVDVPENRLAEIRRTPDVTLSLWAAPKQILHGRVREIGALADPASRTFAVRVSVLDAPPGLMALGMTASVCFGTADNVAAALPTTALTDRDGHPAVWVLDPALHRASLRPVDIMGYGGDGSVLVRAGLADGDQVVTAGLAQIEPGMALTAWAGATR
jgi:membrane fusion protein, multidrug efflux system